MEILHELMQHDIEYFRKLYLLGIKSAIYWTLHRNIYFYNGIFFEGETLFKILLNFSSELKQRLTNNFSKLKRKKLRLYIKCSKV